MSKGTCRLIQMYSHKKTEFYGAIDLHHLPTALESIDVSDNYLSVVYR